MRILARNASLVFAVRLMVRYCPDLWGWKQDNRRLAILYAWFRNLVNWPVQNLLANSSLLDEATKQKLAEEIENNTLVALSKAASALPLADANITALDWVNGRRTPDADQTVSMAIAGLKMGSEAPHIFRALVEATAFGARAIIERFKSEGVAVTSVVAIGGISKKSDFVMQTCADAWNCPIEVLESEQSCALGAAIFAAVCGGVYPTVAEAQKSHGIAHLQNLYAECAGGCNLRQALSTVSSARKICRRR